jgi:hypothetical protein
VVVILFKLGRNMLALAGQGFPVVLLVVLLQPGGESMAASPPRLEQAAVAQVFEHPVAEVQGIYKGDDLV